MKFYEINYNGEKSPINIQQLQFSDIEEILENIGFTSFGVEDIYGWGYVARKGNDAVIYFANWATPFAIFKNISDDDLQELIFGLGSLDYGDELEDSGFYDKLQMEDFGENVSEAIYKLFCTE